MNYRLVFLLLAAAHCSTAIAAKHNPERPYKGYAIIGNGSLCAVYSDDSRICDKTKLRGIQHFYVNDYTVDYIASTSFDLIDSAGHTMPHRDSTGMKNYFTPATYSTFDRGITGTAMCFMHPQGVVLSCAVTRADPSSMLRCRIVLRKRFEGSGTTTLTSAAVSGRTAIASYSNGVVLGIASKDPAATIVVRDSIVEITGATGAGEMNDIIIAAGAADREMSDRLSKALSDSRPALTAQSTWDSWLAQGKLPRFRSGGARLVDAYKRNLYAARSAVLNGQVPADITGQFTTNNMPQLYPRDAMMCARVFLETGHVAEAKSIIAFWAGANIQRKSPGEFYARYDAHGRAVDAGSGARFDEPEWDANGYLIQLLALYHARTQTSLAPVDTIYALADFLTRSIDSTGLLYEGGIVEWTGYLPTTNMVCAAGLLTASRLAGSMHDTARASRYLAAARTITRSLHKTFDKRTQAYMALRFHGEKAEGNRSISTPARDTLYLWDTTVNFGVLWGAPLTPEVVTTNEFYAAHTIGLGGGMQYFDAVQEWLIGYGHDVFFFTTAAAAQYEARFGQPAKASGFIDWMTSHANTYGLMPERIYLNGTDCSDASPLSWCCAEYALAILEVSRHTK
jgi:hypothetical protein